ncbi:MAG: peptidase M16 [Chloroflexi bacterium]|nr:peptidase M16 [Chloroflexota bacterium]
MTTVHGFELISTRDIPELNTTARRYRHVKTGAELLSMENADENKVFGVSFATPPPDSTGLPHIMEHSVLCGSRKYPLKEPFVELLKGSLKTFLNAMTFSDKTVYPVASQNLQDFYNLVDVYLDAVFYPNITPFTLKQEGWHYELDSLDAPLVYKGVVFNEMKGAYSDPDNLMYRRIEASLFPNGPYGVDSGGDPAAIPDLTFEQFRQFHDTYYHPSNALIYFYGDDVPEERLRYLNEWLQAFEPLDVDAHVPLHKPFEAPKRLEYGYAVSQDEQNGKGTRLTLNWALCDIFEIETVLGLSILNHILIGTPASPLRKALIDSGLGEDLAGFGMDSDTRQPIFSTGLKGIALDDVDTVESLITDTLAQLATNGIEGDMIEASMNTVEFELRENNTGPYPRGLLVMIRALRTWLHDGDPVDMVAFEAPLNAIKNRLAQGERYFENLIQQYLINNPHRTTLVLKPDPEKAQRDDAVEKERLAQARAAMSPDELQQVLDDAQTLKQMQETPDAPEDLAKIPSLALDDLDKENKLIPLETLELRGSSVLYHDLFTNGIVYLDLGMDLHVLPQEYVPYMGLFGRLLLEMGTETEDFVKLSQRIGRKTGGIHATNFASTHLSSNDGTAWGFLRGKATIAQADDLLDILRDILLTVRLDNPERFRQIVLEEKASHEAMLIPGGHRVVFSRLGAHFNEAGWVNEQTGGISFLFFLRNLAETAQSDWPAVLEKLETIRNLLVNRNAMLCNVTVDGENWQTFRPQLADFLAGLPAADLTLYQWTRAAQPTNEGLTIPAQVNYVGQAANLYQLGYELHGSSLVITNFLRTTWLWDRIRVQGGAYGAFSLFDPRSGVFTYASYRDPNLLETLDNYAKTSQFLRNLDLSHEEIVKSIIGGIGIMDAYQLPDARGYTSMQRYLTGETDAIRQQRRNEVLSTSLDDFKRFGAILEGVAQNGVVAVLGSAEAITAANVTQNDFLRVVNVL